MHLTPAIPRLYSANNTHVYEIGSIHIIVTVGSGGFQIERGNITFPSTDGSAGHFLKTDGNGVLSLATSASSFNNSTFTGNTVFSSNAVFENAVTFNQPVTAASAFNFTGAVTFTGGNLSRFFKTYC